MIYLVLELIEDGASHEDIFRHYPNLTPEHIEAHGGFENYKKAKGKLFAHLMARELKDRICRAEHCSARTKCAEGRVPKIIVVNADDEYAQYFLSFKADKKIGFTVRKDAPPSIGIVGAESHSAPPIMVEKGAVRVDEMFIANNVNVTTRGTSFEVNNIKINLQMLGAFNVYNALAAVALGMEEGLSLKQIKIGLESVKGVAGRMELIDEGQPFTVIVDYAPEPASMGKLYETVQKINKSIKQEGIEASKQRSIEAKETNSPSVLTGGGERKRIIHVLGSCGGGRDKARRPVLGRLAGKNADVVIVTNEDPYDDDPMEIINEVVAGAIEVGKELDKNLFKILDRKEAIGKAISLAAAGDLVLITGKGSEQAMAVADGKLIPWDDRRVVRAWLQGQR